MPFFDYQGQIISYEITGQGEDFVFLHGLGASKQQSAATMEKLGGFRLITIDMPGHGESILEPKNKQPNSFEYFGHIVIALLDNLNIKRAHFGGISMGAGMSLQIGQLYSERVKSLTLVRPAWLNQASPVNLTIIRLLGQWIEERGIEYAKWQLNSNQFFVELQKCNALAAESISAGLTRLQAEQGARVLTEMVNDRPIASLQSLQTLDLPTLVIGNDQDPLHPDIIAKNLAANIPGAQYRKIASRYKHAVLHQAVLLKTVGDFLFGVSKSNLQEFTSVQ